MFTISKAPTLLETATDKALRSLDEKEIASEDYVKILDVVSKLHKMKEDERPSRLSMDTAAIVTANLLGIMMIIRYEHVNVITSRAMNLVLKPK
jgi:hypothetical protein